MAFECPSCGDPKLEISSSLELPPRGDDGWGTLQNLKYAGYGLHACGSVPGIPAGRKSRLRRELPIPSSTRIEALSSWAVSLSLNHSSDNSQFIEPLETPQVKNEDPALKKKHCQFCQS